MASSSSVYLDPRFDLLFASKSRTLSLWPVSRCPRCQASQWSVRSYCSQCHGPLRQSKRTVHDSGGQCPGVHFSKGSLNQLKDAPLPVHLALVDRIQRVFALLEDEKDQAWSLIVDERAAFAAGDLEAAQSPAGSEKHFHLRHPWFSLTGPSFRLTLIQGFHVQVVKRFEGLKVTTEQSHTPRFELLYECLGSEPRAPRNLIRETEEELLESLPKVLKSEDVQDQSSVTEITFPKTLARPPQLKEIVESLRVAAGFLFFLILSALVVFGPARRHLEIYRLARSLSGGPKVKQVDRLIELGKDEPPSLEVALKSSDSWAKNNALAALKGMKHPDAVAESLRLSQDLSPIVRHQAIVSLAELGAYEELRSIVKSKNRLDIRQYAIRFLAEKQDKAFAKDALKLVSNKDLDEDVRVELLCSFSSVAPKGEVKVLEVVEAILKDESERSPVRHAAVFAHINCGGEIEIIAQTLSNLVAKIDAKPARLKTHRLTVRAAIHGLRESPKIQHQELLRSLKDKSWIDADLLRIARRSLRPPSKF